MAHLKIYLFLLLITSVLTTSVEAQQKKNNADSLKPYQLFIEKSTAYKRTPLQLELELRSETNFITSTADTGTTSGSYFLQPGLTYIQFGEVEQIVTDSMALIISQNLKQMFMYNDTATVGATLRSMMNLNQVNASLAEITKRYVATIDSTSGFAKIMLTSRYNLLSTSLPVESLELQYNQLRSEPVSVKTVKRTLIPISKEQYQEFIAENSLLQLLKLDSERHCIVKEQSTLFTYKSIRHDANINSPVAITDRIKKKTDGSYIGVNNYADYIITTN